MAHEKPNRKQYLIIFVVLALLTVLEVGVAKMPGMGKGLLVSALILLAVTKAAIVALYYMHLKGETRVLRLTVGIPLMMPPVYAVILIAEASWRYLS